ncbi:hypothetical protein WJT86_12100 [Microvirga sp. W0021]|uniref:Uncharacterized protein n=1 Tax=Hohaiivirga grylli TaxID=3133970 RepID=A0ABV0BLJ4_9HYPH
MPNIEELFEAANGLIIWDACVSYGSAVFFEFGTPHLRVREALENVNKGSRLSRRNVRVVGEFELLTVDCYWIIESEFGSINSEDDLSNLNSFFNKIKGERVSKCTFKNEVLTISFDFGSKLIIKKLEHLDEVHSLFMISDSNDNVIEVLNNWSIDLT